MFVIFVFYCSCSYAVPVTAPLPYFLTWTIEKSKTPNCHQAPPPPNAPASAHGRSATTEMGSEVNYCRQRRGYYAAQPRYYTVQRPI